MNKYKNLLHYRLLKLLLLKTKKYEISADFLVYKNRGIIKKFLCFYREKSIRTTWISTIFFIIQTFPRFFQTFCTQKAGKVFIYQKFMQIKVVLVLFPSNISKARFS